MPDYAGHLYTHTSSLNCNSQLLYKNQNREVFFFSPLAQKSPLKNPSIYGVVQPDLPSTATREASIPHTSTAVDGRCAFDHMSGICKVQLLVFTQN